MNPKTASSLIDGESPWRTRPAPLLPVAIGLAVGVAVDNAFEPGAIVHGLCVGLAIAGISVGWVRRRAAWAVGMLAALGLGGILHDASYRRVAPDHIVHYVGADPITARVSGRVVSRPRVLSRRDWFFGRWTYSPDTTRFLMKAESIKGRQGAIAVSGTLSVKVIGVVDGVHPGDRVTVLGRLYRPPPPGNPGQFDYARWQRRHGIYATMRCQNKDLVVVDAAGVDRWRAWLAQLQALARATLIDDEATTQDQESALLETMVLGRRGAVDEKTERLFLRTGTTHFLAVSGMHVGVVAGCAWFGGRRIGGTRRRSAMFAAAAIALYVCVVDPRPPVLRAGIIGLVYCAAMQLRRSTSGGNSLALAAIVLLCARPAMLFEPGFQMSFAGVFAICYLHRPLLGVWYGIVRTWSVPTDSFGIRQSPPSLPASVWRGVRRRTCEIAAVGLAACLATTPFVGVHFGRIAPLACVFSLILLPFFAMTVFCGFATVSLGLINPGLLTVTRPAAETSAALLLRVVGGLEQISPEFRGWWAVFFTCVYIGVVGALVGSVRIGGATLWQVVRGRVVEFLRPGGGLSVARCAGLTVVLLAVVALGVMATGGEGPEETLRVTHLSVGSGTAVVIEFPNGEVWLYDCGSLGSYDIGESVVVPYCRERGIRRIDRAVVSHPNLDHFSGLISVMDAMPTGPVAVNGRFERFAPAGGPAQALLGELERRKHAVEAVADLDGVTVGGVVVEVLWPTDDPRGGTTGNDSSTVLRLSYLGRSMLLCGDVGRYGIAGLLDGSRPLAADVLILPHHGGWVSNTAAFIEAVDPQVCVRSSWRRARDTSEALVEAIAGRSFFSTSDDGAVTVVIDEAGLTVRGFGERGGDRAYAIARGDSQR